MAAPVEVAAGLLFRNGRLLIAQRPAGAHLAGLWEFPGGKRELGETYEKCLARELFEELGTEVEVGRLLEEVTHDYPERAVRLRFYRCRWVQHEPRPLHCQAVAWIGADQLSQYAFPAADARLLARLRAEWEQIQLWP
ncbi:MAG TPA: 8-oxo-dGTP diphosphatase MutT [Verrucomicrobiae bacterium]|jgi:mutator protein MutT|nr:8-oxo-dGTP diphosphatase MutT [Verrucomicrobiae bacterium]